ncbi:MAG: Crp/Fnr family transcriptional regulator [Bacteroidota bacterium]|jgi:CRP/FNR family transcriptional regulator
MLSKETLTKLFPDWEDGLYDAILNEAELKEAKAGTTLLKMGQNIKSAMLVVEGTIKLYQEDEAGGEYFMYHLNPGEACAVTLVCNYHHEQSQVLAKAVTDIQYLTIPIAFMEKWLNEFKSWHYFVIKTYRSRYEELLKTINEIAFKNMDERLEFYILKYVKQFGSIVNLTHQDIANDLNSSREVISRLLKKMEHNGWIVMNRNSFDWIKK